MSENVALRVIAHNQIGETPKGFLRRVGMNRGQRTRMACVEGIEQRSCLDSADFAEDDPVRSPAESGLQKVVERDVGLERIGLAFDCQNVRLLDLKLGGVLDDDDAILFGNKVGKYPQERGFSGPGSATDKQRLSAANLLG